MEPQAFISKIKDAAIEENKKVGIPASLTIAQAILETGWGESELAKKANNLFGLKGSGPAGTYEKESPEYRNGKKTIEKSIFCKYNSWGECIKYRSERLLTPRYAKVIGTDWRTACVEVWKAGYATDPEYPDKLMDIIQRYKLYQHDKEEYGVSKLVVIDPGHGMPDPGACGNGLQEHERAFALAQLVGKVLTRHGVTVLFTRNGERSLSSATNLKTNKNEDLVARQRFSNSKATDFFLSLHMNASNDPTANGYETLCYSQNGQIEVLHTAVKAFLQQHGLKDRGIKIRTNLAVLKVRAKAALLECFFITNPKEAALMSDAAFLLDLAEAIGKGVLAAIGIAYVSVKKPAAPQPIQPKEEQLMKTEDANKIIRILQDRWNASTCQDEKKEIGRLADEVRVAAGMKKVNS